MKMATNAKWRLELRAKMGLKRGQTYTLAKTDACRAKIKTSAHIRRLEQHLAGEIELTPTQVRCAEILLNKTLANLSAQEITGDVTKYVARLPTPAANAEEWAKNVASEKAQEARTATNTEADSGQPTKH